MVEDKKGLNDFFVNGLDRNRDIVDFLIFLYDDWDDISHQYDKRRDWGTKKDWIVLFAGNKNSMVARDFVDELISTGVLEKTSFRSNSGTQNSVGLFWTSNGFKKVIWDVFLPRFKLYKFVVDRSDIRYDL